MSGTVAGGRSAAKTNKARYGSDFYERIGAKGGRNGTTGGFAANQALAREAGHKGGKLSSRGIPRLLIIGGRRFNFDTVKEATEFAKKNFGVRSSRFVDGNKVLTLADESTATIIRDPTKIY